MLEDASHSDVGACSPQAKVDVQKPPRAWKRAPIEGPVTCMRDTTAAHFSLRLTYPAQNCTARTVLLRLFNSASNKYPAMQRG